MTRILVDTNVLLRDMPAFDPEDELAVSSVVYAELEAGVRLAATGEERARRVRHLALVRDTYGEGLPFDDRVASSFGTLVELVEASGRRARSRTADLMIAATAHAHGAALVTYNTSDFEGLGGVVSILDASAR